MYFLKEISVSLFLSFFLWCLFIFEIGSHSVARLDLNSQFLYISLLSADIMDMDGQSKLPCWYHGFVLILFLHKCCVLNTAVVIVHLFLYVMFSFSFYSKYFLVSLTSSLTISYLKGYSLFKDVKVFLSACLLPTYWIMPKWSENTHFIIWTFINYWKLICGPECGLSQ